MCKLFVEMLGDALCAIEEDLVSFVCLLSFYVLVTLSRLSLLFE